MKIGLLTDSLSALPLGEVLATAARLGVQTVEIPTGNWSAAPHVNLSQLSSDRAAREDLAQTVKDFGLELEALNCSGNPLHPRTGAQQSQVIRDTIELAAELGVQTVVTMSGLPAAPGDSSPNWITTCWPPEVLDILEYQWNEIAIPYWSDLAEFSRARGVRLALEFHPHQLVYNVRSFGRLRDAVGDTVGVNLDPSHPMWMGADPIGMIAALGDAIYHVHAKDTRIEAEAGVNTLYEVRPFDQVPDRAWNYVTLGNGHPGGAQFWRRFVSALEAAGYAGVLSIEHEDAALPPVDGVAASVEVLRDALSHRPIAA